MTREPLSARLLASMYAPVKAVLKPVLGRFPTLNKACIALKERVREATRARTVVRPLRDRLIAEAGVDATHLFLVRWIHRGGADLETLNYLEALASISINGVTVIATFDGDSPWSDRVPDGVRFVAFGAAMRGLSWREKQSLLMGYLRAARPRVIHNINSELAYKTFCRFGSKLASHSDLYASVFCTDLDEKGEPGGYGIYLARCYAHLHGVFCDNENHLRELQDRYRIDGSKMHVHYQPIRTQVTRRAVPRREYLSVLWAGRWDRQKRPDILAKIAESCQEAEIRFVAYGSPLLDNEAAASMLQRAPNVDCRGTFNGLSSLPLDDFDVLLLTSQWEGLPNILLEAMSAGLPVLSSRVGGVAELIEHGVTGFLVDPFDDIERYESLLLEIRSDRSRLESIALAASKLVQHKHSWTSFEHALSTTPEYLRPEPR
ncbi:MAG: glycosyltransferase family 4 protein [Planctomycetes bacterium]|nr:glycosyltransferase family 4 protein [Planctomycetota bacterium]